MQTSNQKKEDDPIDPFQVSGVNDTKHGTVDGFQGVRFYF